MAEYLSTWASSINPWLLVVPVVIIIVTMLLSWRLSLAVPLGVSLALHLVPAMTLRSGITTNSATEPEAPPPEIQLLVLPMKSVDTTQHQQAAEKDPLPLPPQNALPDQYLAVTPSAMQGELPSLQRLDTRTLNLPESSDGSSLAEIDWAGVSDVISMIDQRLEDNGGVKGVVTCTLVWSNHNDLDLHVITPAGHRIYFGDKYGPRTPNQRKLDVDRNAGSSGWTNKPIENIRWRAEDAPLTGVYKVYVDHFAKRTSAPSQFLLRVEVDSQLIALIPGTITFQSSNSQAPEVYLGQFTYPGGAFQRP